MQTEARWKTACLLRCFHILRGSPDGIQRLRYFCVDLVSRSGADDGSWLPRDGRERFLDEVLGFWPDFIEHQLAHAVRDPNGRAYNRTAFLPERKVMMQAWADYLDRLRVGEDPEARCQIVMGTR